MSRGDKLLLIAVLAAFGIADSAYLAWQWYAAASASWCDVGSFFNCSRVRDSPYSAFAGIPTAWVGVLGFGILLALTVLALRGFEGIGPSSIDRWILGFSVLGAGSGVVLTLIEVFVIEAICILCVVGFLLDLGILGVAAFLARPDA